ncbi:MAG: CDP-diacylglycerol--glycerol-3-phosphate 3-phosphatidyltransferase [Candidatus Aminicenantes bacterium]|nr:CDP-diacylglycerol--glycerol-3-phosphate 3-phosphatidyltransferase [Candidatus Aminicenantes bacterium]
MNAPNALTTFRILLVPVLMAFLLAGFRGHEWFALGVFWLAMLTDTVDGILARRTNAITELGKLLDPIADKLLITAAFVCLVEAGNVPAWMAVVIIGRELAVTGFRAIAASKGIVIAASWPGKIKVWLETAAISLLLVKPAWLGSLAGAPRVFLWLTMAAAVYSAAEYFVKYGPGLVRENP